MVVEYIRYEIAPGEADAFIAAYREAAKDLEHSPHCLGYEMARGIEEPQRFTIRLLWDSVDGHLGGFRKSANFASFLQKIRPYIGAIQEMKHYEVFASRTKPAAS